LFVFDAERHSLLHTIPGAHFGRINGLAGSRTGQVWSCSDDRTVRVWDADRFLPVRTLRGASSKVLSLEMVDMHAWAGGFDTSIIVFDIKSHLPVAELKGQHTDSVNATSWITTSPGARTLVSSGRDGLLSVWKYRDGVELDPSKPVLPRVRHSFSTGSVDETESSDTSSSPRSARGRKNRRGRFLRTASRSRSRSGSRSPRRSSKSPMEQSQSRSYTNLSTSRSRSRSSKRDSLAIPSSKSSRFPWRSRKSRVGVWFLFLLACLLSSSFSFAFSSPRVPLFIVLAVILLVLSTHTAHLLHVRCVGVFSSPSSPSFLRSYYY
jgi:WD domain, G-beta repeat